MSIILLVKFLLVICFFFYLKGSRIDPAFPYIVFAIANIAVGVLCFLLPETNNLPLPNNIQEAIDMEK
jgi:OCT family organic cation transporter-like MFS transporter 4/5